MPTTQIIIQLADLNKTEPNLSQLPPAILMEANKLNEPRRKQFLVCRSILADLLQRYYAISTLPDMVISTNNRPVFRDNLLPDFNITHSENRVAVAISQNGQVGVDIELTRQRKNYLAVAKSFFADDEYEWMIKQSDVLDAFWQLWTLKESALKLYAKGVWQMKSVNIDLEKRRISAPFATHFYYQYHQVGKVHLSVNSNQPISELILLAP